MPIQGAKPASEFSEYLPETRFNTSADFNMYPMRIFAVYTYTNKFKTKILYWNDQHFETEFKILWYGNIMCYVMRDTIKLLVSTYLMSVQKCTNYISRN